MKVNIRNIKISSEYYPDIVERYLAGESSEKICLDYNVRALTICRILRRNGIIPHGNKPRKYFFNEDYFKIIDTEDKAYFLGLMYADGNCHHKSGLVSISLQARDEDILKEFISYIGFTGKLIACKKKNPKHQIQLRLELHSRKFQDTLIKVGCVPKKSLILKFP